MKKVYTKIRAFILDWLEVPNWRLEDMYCKSELQTMLLEKEIEQQIKYFSKKGD